ncbi:ATP-binding cassette domain-containing protein [Lachnospiraceae bacterium 45-W7]
MEIVIKNLSPNYGKKAALEQVSVTIYSGMYGLLGCNGSGKTSLMKILATLLPPSGGEITMNGIPIQKTGKIREIVGQPTNTYC